MYINWALKHVHIAALWPQLVNFVFIGYTKSSLFSLVNNFEIDYFFQEKLLELS